MAVSSARAAAVRSAPVLACPRTPQPPSGDSVSSTHVRSVNGWVTSGGRDDLGQLLYDTELLVAIEHPDRSQYLHTDVVAVAGDVGQRIGRQVVHKRCGGVPEERDIRNLLPPHHGGCEVLGERLAVAERSFLGVDVDHRHRGSPSLVMTIVIVADPTLCCSS